MLETNSRLLATYLDAYQITHASHYKDAAKKTVSYMFACLASKDGCFFGSQDADGEGEYYGKKLEDRQKMPAPSVDKTIYVNLNCMAASAFIKAYLMLGEEYCMEFALKTINLLSGSQNTIGHCYSEGSKDSAGGLTADYAFMIKALLDAYELTGDKAYLERADNLAQFLLKNMQDKEGGFFDRKHSEEDIGYLKIRNKSLTENSLCAENFLRLGILFARDEYKKIAEKTLETFVNSYQRYGLHSAAYAAAIEKFLDPIEIIAVGIRVPGLLRHFDGRKVVQVLEEKDAQKKGYTKGLYICYRMACRKFDSAEEALLYLQSI
jgi:uncharacterized protein YyaL (SSP411 family)